MVSELAKARQKPLLASKPQAFRLLLIGLSRPQLTTTAETARTHSPGSLLQRQRVPAPLIPTILL